MLSLDFKLTSAQVKALLYYWHGSGFSIGKHYPAVEFFRSPLLTTVAGTLLKKGLLMMVKVNEPLYTGEVEVVRVSPAGEALAEHIVMQAQKILALDTSRKECQADLKRARRERAKRARPTPRSPETK